VNCLYCCGRTSCCSAAAAAAAPPPALLLNNKLPPNVKPIGPRQFQGVPRTDAISNYFVVMKVCPVLPQHMCGCAAVWACCRNPCPGYWLVHKQLAAGVSTPPLPAAAAAVRTHWSVQAVTMRAWQQCKLSKSDTSKRCTAQRIGRCWKYWILLLPTASAARKHWSLDFCLWQLQLQQHQQPAPVLSDLSLCLVFVHSAAAAAAATGQ
jgi:hypothetical protein